MYNKSTIIGRLGRDSDIRYTAEQKAIANLAVATTESWKDRDTGQRKQRTEWHRIVLFGKLAETARDYLKKGTLVLFEGSIRTRKWQDDAGQDHYTTEIHADEMKMMPSSSRGSPSPTSGDSTGADQAHTSYDDIDDDIPF